MLWLDWKRSYDTMECPGCHFRFDGEAAISIVTSHEPSKNSGNFERVRADIRRKKEAVLRQMDPDRQHQLPPPQRAGGYPADYTPNPLVEAMVASYQDSRQNPGVPPAQSQGGTAGRRYYDCPDCGQTYFTDHYDATSRIECDGCGCGFAMVRGLNLRTTPERVAKHGMLTSWLRGDGIQYSERERLETRAETLQAAINNAMLNGNYGAAQVHQLKLNDILRRLERFG
jgi:hypothetical protein